MINRTLIGCALLIFATFAVTNPYLKIMVLTPALIIFVINIVEMTRKKL